MTRSLLLMLCLCTASSCAAPAEIGPPKVVAPSASAPVEPRVTPAGSGSEKVTSVETTSDDATVVATPQPDPCDEFNRNQSRLSFEEHVREFGCPPCPCACINGEIRCAPCIPCEPTPPPRPSP